MAGLLTGHLGIYMGTLTSRDIVHPLAHFLYLMLTSPEFEAELRIPASNDPVPTAPLADLLPRNYSKPIREVVTRAPEPTEKLSDTWCANELEDSVVSAPATDSPKAPLLDTGSSLSTPTALSRASTLDSLPEDAGRISAMGGPGLVGSRVWGGLES